MKVKITIGWIFVVILFAGFAVSCGGSNNSSDTGGSGKYADLNKFVDEYIAFVDKMETALDSNDLQKVTAAYMEFGEKMEKLEPKLNELDKKYPELMSGNVPPELKEIKKKLDGAEEKFERVGDKMANFMQEQSGGMMKGLLDE